MHATLVILGNKEESKFLYILGRLGLYNKYQAHQGSAVSSNLGEGGQVAGEVVQRIKLDVFVRG